MHAAVQHVEATGGRILEVFETFRVSVQAAPTRLR
jgi:hypothetical protein